VPQRETAAECRSAPLFHGAVRPALAGEAPPPKSARLKTGWDFSGRSRFWGYTGACQFNLAGSPYRQVDWKDD